MKLASLKHGRDGRLVVVSRDLSRATDAGMIASTLQAALDDWERCEPGLVDLARRLEAHEISSFEFEETNCAAPIPRAYQWLDGSSYINHVELARRARGAELPASFLVDPLMYQGGSDSFLAPRDAILMDDEDWGIDFEAEVAVVTGDVRFGASVEQAAQSIRLVALVNDVSLRNLIPPELGKGFGFLQSKPSTAFAPVAVTADELGESWRDGRVHLPLLSYVNDELMGRPNAGLDMAFNFPTLIAHAAKTRRLSAGTIIGSGTVSNKGIDGSPGLPVAQGGLGYSCIVEQRTVETLLHGQPRTPYLRFLDRVRIEMKKDGCSVFGAIEQTVRRPDDDPA